MFDYSTNYYERLRNGSHTSAREIVPLVLDWIAPESVVDVGCGTGTWLSVFQAHGVEDILGIDGNNLEEDLLEIPGERFMAADLTQDLTIDRRFDLAVCLEVAEHLPEESAERLIDLLTGLAPVVLFSAAVPFQGGHHHVNEQWPDYWRRLFLERNSVAIDCLRRHVWDNDAVEWWYAQNTLVFVDEEHLSAYPALQAEHESGRDSRLAVVHPENYIRAHWHTRLKLVERNLRQLVGEDEQIILVDDGNFGEELALDSITIPFLERNGQYNGRPSDSHTAIQELERLRGRGAGFIAFTWPAFWWLDYYHELKAYLQRRFRVVVDDDHVKVFDLNTRQDNAHPQ